MVKVLLLGIGRWGANHLRVLHSLPIELYVAEPDAKRLESARALGIPAERLAASHRDLAQRVDAAVVVTPAASHFELGREFLQAGKDVFVEKPITLHSKDARELARLAEQHQRILQVGHIFRFDPAAQWLREAIRQGQFGRLRMLRGKFCGFKRPRNDSGVSFADAIHFVDLCNFLVGRLPARVTALVKDFLGRGMDDESFIAMDYDVPEGQVWATVETGYYVPGKFREMILVGDQLSAVCDFNAAQYKVKTFRNQHMPGTGEFKAVEGEVHQLEFPPEEPLLAELRAFLNSIQTRQAPLAGGQAGYESVRVLEAALDSARAGRSVELAPEAP